ncbi:unknown [Eubacterium sp. CAG:115]|nr:unknown [Eubacterium sp. CAG:115]
MPAYIAAGHRHIKVDVLPGLAAVGGNVEVVAECAVCLLVVYVLGHCHHSVGVGWVDNNVAVAVLFRCDVSNGIISDIKQADTAVAAGIVPRTLGGSVCQHDLSVAVVLHALDHQTLRGVLNGSPRSARVGGFVEVVVALAGDGGVDRGAGRIIAGLRVDEDAADAAVVIGVGIGAEVEVAEGLTAVGGLYQTAAAHSRGIYDVAVLGVDRKAFAVSATHSVAVDIYVVGELSAGEGAAVVIGDKQRGPAAAEVACSCEEVNAVRVLIAVGEASDAEESLVLLAYAVGHGLPELCVLIVAVRAADVGAGVVEPFLAGRKNAADESAAAYRYLVEFPAVCGHVGGCRLARGGTAVVRSAAFRTAGFILGAACNADRCRSRKQYA